MAEIKGFQLNAVSSTAIVVGAVLLIGYWVIFGKSKEDIEQDKLTDIANDNVDAVIADQENKGVKATWDDYVYKQYADTLYECMDGMGTNELGVSRVFEHILNKVDYAKLYKFYGVRDGNNLPEDIQSELSAYWIKQINGMLARNNVGVKF